MRGMHARTSSDARYRTTYPWADFVLFQTTAVLAFFAGHVEVLLSFFSPFTRSCLSLTAIGSGVAISYNTSSTRPSVCGMLYCTPTYPPTYPGQPKLKKKKKPFCGLPSRGGVLCLPLALPALPILCISGSLYVLLCFSSPTVLLCVEAVPPLFKDSRSCSLVCSKQWGPC